MSFPYSLFEACFLGVSFICHVGLFVILLVFQQKRQPELPDGITLNTILSLISTASKSSMLAVVGACLAQAKWCQVYRRRTPLIYVQAYDDAASGPLGSVRLLCGRTAKSLVSIGAIIILAALGYDASVQQLLAFPNDSATLVNATRATAYLAADEGYRIQAINNAIYGDITDFGRQPQCPTGNCTWDPYTSVGWCSNCVNETDIRFTSDCDFSFDVSDMDEDEPYDGLCTVAFDKGIGHDLTWTAHYSKSEQRWRLAADLEAIWVVAKSSDFDSPSLESTFDDIVWPQLVLDYVEMLWNNATNPEQGMHVSTLQRCILSYCTTKDSVAVKGGLAHVERGAINFGTPFLKPDSGVPCWTADPSSIAKATYTTINLTTKGKDFLGGVTNQYSIDPERFTFCLDDNQSSQGSDKWATEMSRSIVGTRHLQTAFADVTNDTLDIGEVGDAFLHVLGFDGPYTALETVVRRICASYTDLGLEYMGATSQLVPGTMFYETTSVQVRWGWFTLPLSLWTMTAIYLWTVIQISRRYGVPIWKGSTLAYLYHGLEWQEHYQKPRNDAEKELHQSEGQAPLGLPVLPALSTKQAQPAPSSKQVPQAQCRGSVMNDFRRISEVEKAAEQTHVRLKTGNLGRLMFVQECK